MRGFSLSTVICRSEAQNLTKGKRARSTWTRKRDASSSALLNFSTVVRNWSGARRIFKTFKTFKTMITIRSSAASSEPTLIALETALTTAQGIYTISSNSSGADSTSTFSGGLFGAISWPLSRFQLAPGVVLEQQIFLPHDGSAAAFSWQLYAQSPLRTRLTIKPFFSGCGPRSYRDVGFRLEAEQEGGRLTWLPNVRGPKVIADTNGQYHDARTRFIECSRDQGTSASSENLVTPGRFEFELSRRPSVLIFSMEGYASTQRNQHVGAFLAGLIQEDSTLGRDLVIDRGCGTRTSAELVAA